MEYFVFCSGKETIKTAKMRFPEAEFAVYNGVIEESVSLRQSRKVIFYMKNRDLTNVAMQSSALRDKEIYVYPYDIESVSRAIRIDPSKPRLDYLETEISYRCNLNCRGCCDFCNLEVYNGFYDFDMFCRDLSRIKELFWGVERIRLMGGVPLLNLRFADYAEKTRALFPDADIRIVTNGLLIPELSKDVLLRIRKNGVCFDISNYPPTQKRMREIKKTLCEADVRYHFSFPIYFFYKTLLENPTDTPEKAFGNCIFTHCHMMGNGKLSPCSYAHCIFRFNTYFGTSYPEDDYVDLYAQDIDGYIINDYFSHPHTFCRYCAGGMMPILWKKGVMRAKKKKEDWLIQDSPFAKVVLPGMQSIMKNVFMQLRTYIQK